MGKIRIRLLKHNLPFTVIVLMAGLASVVCERTGPTDPTAGDVQLAPPPPGQGLQIVIEPFEVPVGEEVQRNYYRKLPSDVDIYVTNVEMVYNPGSHHVNVFKNDEPVPDRVEDTFKAVQWESWDMVFASQREELHWQLPPGVAIPLKAQQQLDIQVHYVNAGTQQTANGRGKVIINLWTVPKESVQSYLGALFANNRLLNIPPGADTTYMKMIRPIEWDINIVVLSGHFHSRGRSFWVKHLNSGQEVYRNEDWDEPPVTFYDPPLQLPAYERLAYWTRFYNPTQDTIKFGPHVEYEEHANLFMFFYPGPADGKAIYDFEAIW
jgi:hypothetical protein